MKNAYIDKSRYKEIILHCDQNYSYFFGYYDRTPWSLGGDKILTHRTTSKKTYIEQGDLLELGYFEVIGDFPSYNVISKLNVCNWQQGSMPAWIKSRYSVSDHVIFNDLVGDVYAAQIMTTEGELIRSFDYPLSDLSYDGSFYLSISSSRLYFTRRAYSYEGEHDNRWNDDVVENDGLRIVEIESGKSDFLVKTKDLVDDLVESMTEAKHWIDHPLFSPDSKNILFYHRWLTKKGTFFTRLYSYNIQNKSFFLYPDSGMYSHATWQDNDCFLVFGRGKSSDPRLKKDAGYIYKGLLNIGLFGYKFLKNLSYIKKFRKKVLKDNYLLFRLKEENPRVIDTSPFLNLDGHPSFCPANKEVFITDTYPDSEDMRALYTKNISSGEVALVGNFPVPAGHNDSSPDRCDLHPRWDRSGRYISIDSMHDGIRKQHVFCCQ